MFKKVLIANRGEVAVRIIRACREMGLETVALYDGSDLDSLHVRLADECALVEAPAGLRDPQLIVSIALAKGASAIHPGYGFLAEEPAFIAACEAANITFIGPPAGVVAQLVNKIDTLDKAQAAGFPTVSYSSHSFAPDQLAELAAQAGQMGYPLVIKSCAGGRGRGERLVFSPGRLAESVRRAQAEAQTIYGSCSLYLEKAILPAHQVGVQILADRYGHLIHLGEREGSVQYSNRKVIEESPAPCLNQTQRQALWETALALARLFHCQNACTVEFLINGNGQFYFSEIKPRLQVEHPLTEMVTRIDLVRAQIALAAGQPLTLSQDDVRPEGWAMLCRINAEDPWHRFLPAPGTLRQLRFPAGPEIRLDSCAYERYTLSPAYDSLLAKLTVWGRDRQQSLARMSCALEELKLVGVPTNLPYLQRILRAPAFVQGQYDIQLLSQPFDEGQTESESYYQELAVAAAILYARRNQSFHPTLPERLQSNWHRHNRRLSG